MDVPFTLGEPLPAPTGEPSSVHDAPVRLGETYRITTDATGHFAFSPDGKYVVYLSAREGIVRCDPYGENRLVLYSSGPGYFRITPDSRYVVFPSFSNLVRVPLEGGAPVILARGLSDNTSIEISPDSRWLTYAGIAEPATLIDIDGGPARVAAQTMPGYGTHVHFTPDSAGVVHWSEHKTFYLPVDGDRFRQLAPNLDSAGLMTTWPSGAIVLGPADKIWFAPYDGSDAIGFPGTFNVTGAQASAWLRAVPTVGDTAYNLYYVDMSDHVLHKVNAPLRSDERMAWSDNTAPGWYVYTTYTGYRRKGRQWRVYAVPTGEGTARVLARVDDTYTVVARPTPDGSRVILHADLDDGRMAFFQADLRTGALARVSGHFPGWNNFDVSPDSRHIVFGVNRRGRGVSTSQDPYTLKLPD